MNTSRRNDRGGILLRVDWPTGSKTYFSHAEQMWQAFNGGGGQLAAFAPHVNLVRVEDDGTAQWKQLQAAAQRCPIHMDD